LPWVQTPAADATSQAAIMIAGAVRGRSTISAKPTTPSGARKFIEAAKSNVPMTMPARVGLPPMRA